MPPPLPPPERPVSPLCPDLFSRVSGYVHRLCIRPPGPLFSLIDLRE